MSAVSEKVNPGGMTTGAQIILAYFIETYRPAFRRGNAVVSADGSQVEMGVACATPTSKLIDHLATAADAPVYRGGGVNRNALPHFFKTWGRVAWGDLLAQLPDEDAAEFGGEEAGEDFRRLVREALLSDVVLGDVIAHNDVIQTERRPLVHWCQKFARPGPWRDIRGRLCWCKLREAEGGEVVVCVAIRHELFAQVRADSRLRSMGANRFARLAAKYRVGASTRSDRPHGQAAVVLDEAFVADLLSGLPDDPECGELAPAKGE